MDASDIKIAPSPVEQTRSDSSPPMSQQATSPSPQPSTPRNFNFKQFIKPFANLKLAITELAVIAGLSSIGTIIEQNKPYSYYLDNYPNEGSKVLGFVTADLIWRAQWDHIYTADYFLLTIGFLAISLAACTATTQWPMVKVAQRWRFKNEESAYQSLPFARMVPSASMIDLAESLQSKGYQIFLKESAMYAFKGFAGKIGPIGVHASMLLVMAGIVIGALGGYTGDAMITEGGEALVAPMLRPASPFSWTPAGASAVLKVDDFRIDYRSDGSVRQFFTDFQVLDGDGKVVQQKTISVNQPLRFGGITAYQTDWAMAALTVRVDVQNNDMSRGENDTDGSSAKSKPLTNVNKVNIPMASLEGQPGVSGKLYATFLPIETQNPDNPSAAPQGISFLARDLQSVVVYDSKGNFVGVRRPGSNKPLTVEGVNIIVDDIVASSGIQMKVDPGIPFVYAGFGGMCVTTVVSYLSHSQVWATQLGSTIVVGGRSNRAKFGFEMEMDDTVNALPERSS